MQIVCIFGRATNDVILHMCYNSLLEVLLEVYHYMYTRGPWALMRSHESHTCI